MTGTAKALLVDDRRENLMALEAILQGLPVRSVAVESGEAALKQLLVDDFAVILLDAHMPGMDGFETAAHIKRRERTRHVPIIFMGPGIRAERVDDRVSTLDFAPTLASVARVQFPGNLEGRVLPLR